VSSVKEGNLTADVRNKQQNINDRKLINDKVMITADWLLNTGGHLNPHSSQSEFLGGKS
jgi:hypothetical protein